MIVALSIYFNHTSTKKLIHIAIILTAIYSSVSSLLTFYSTCISWYVKSKACDGHWKECRIVFRD